MPRQKGRKPQEGMIRSVVHGEYEDRYAAKLVKYIPAEVLAAFIPLVALAAKASSGPDSAWVWTTIGIGAVAVVGYHRWQSTDVLKENLRAAHAPGSDEFWDERRLTRELEKRQPHSYFYLLAVVAFAAWALVTALPVREAVGVSSAQAEYIVGAVTFVLPLVDATLDHFWAWTGLEEWHPFKDHAPAGQVPGRGAS